jgi:hypothetical protein
MSGLSFRYWLFEFERLSAQERWNLDRARGGHTAPATKHVYNGGQVSSEQFMFNPFEIPENKVRCILFESGDIVAWTGLGLHDHAIEKLQAINKMPPSRISRKGYLVKMQEGKLGFAVNDGNNNNSATLLAIIHKKHPQMTICDESGQPLPIQDEEW